MCVRNYISNTINISQKKKDCEFIDYEAILSDDSYEGGSSEENSGSDTTLGSFICDENDDADVSIDIESKYLQSIKYNFSSQIFIKFIKP